MFLTNEEEAMLNGEYGEALEIAISVLVKLGDIYEADRMIEVENAHIDSSSYFIIGESGLNLCEKFVDLGATFKVPTTLNPLGIDPHRWQEFRVSESYMEKENRLAEAHISLGGIATWTCAPYQYGANLRFGQNVAWGESNAIVSANSVYGARTERLGDLTDICAAVVGKYPRFGLYLNENRRGQVLFKIESDKLDVKSFSYADYAALGFCIGSLAGTRVPVVTEIPKSVTWDQLKDFGAAIATGGSVGLYHIVGVTPEARTLSEACGGLKPEEVISIGVDEINATREKLSTATEVKADIIVLGCPHYSVEQLKTAAIIVKGKKVVEGVELWIQTSPIAKTLASEMGIIDIIEAAGGKVHVSGCFTMYNYAQEWGFGTLMTDSAKNAYYSSGITGVEVVFDDTEKCIDAATRQRS